MAIVAVALLSPGAARPSGGAPIPVSLDEAVRQADVVVQGRWLGVRRASVHIDRSALAPDGGALGPGEAGLDFEVEEVGVRVTAVLAAPTGGPAKGDEAWFVQPTAYAFGSIGRLAQVAWIAVPQYAGGRAGLAKEGSQILVIGETAAHRRARKQGTAGLDGRLWLVAERSYDGAALAPRVRALLQRRGPGPPGR